ncbi:MAG: hypothetical protein HFJ17_00525 [Clostridia bacterium]|nr:hypothetical protein [Clostridia bacterium]
MNIMRIKSLISAMESLGRNYGYYQPPCLLPPSQEYSSSAEAKTVTKTDAKPSVPDTSFIPRSKRYHCKKPYQRKAVQCNKSTVPKRGIAKAASLSEIAEHNRKIVIERFENKLDKALATHNSLVDLLLELDDKLEKATPVCNQLHDLLMELDGIITLPQENWGKQVINRLERERNRVLRRLNDSSNHIYSMCTNVCFNIPSDSIYDPNDNDAESDLNKRDDDTEPVLNEQNDDARPVLSKCDRENKRHMIRKNRTTARKRKYDKRDFWMKQWECYEEEDYSFDDETRYDISWLEECIEYLTLIYNFGYVSGTGIVQQINHLQNIIDDENLIRSVLG